MLSQRIQQIFNSVDQNTLKNLSQEQKMMLSIEIQRLQNIELQKMAIQFQYQQMVQQYPQKQQGFKLFKRDQTLIISPKQQLKPKVPTFGFDDQVWKSASNSNSQVNEDRSDISCQFEEFNLDELNNKMHQETSKLSTQQQDQNKLTNSENSIKKNVNQKNKKKFRCIEQKIETIVDQLDLENNEFILKNAVMLVIEMLNDENQDLLKHKNLEILGASIVSLLCLQLANNSSPYKIAKIIQCKPKTLIKMNQFVQKFILMNLQGQNMK